jgi:hypothetical protein
MSYSLALAVDVLDQLAQGETPSREEVVRGAIALAIFCKASKERPGTIEMLQLLEQLALGKIDSLGEEDRQDAAVLSSTLRRKFGIH